MKPFGSRPLPGSSAERHKRQQTSLSHGARPQLPTSSSMPTLPGQKTTAVDSRLDPRTRSPFAGRAVVTPLAASRRDNTPPAKFLVKSLSPGSEYLKIGIQWTEQPETRSSNTTLDDVESEEERRIHAAAQDEAAELVFKHRNPDSHLVNPHAPYANPDTRKDSWSHSRNGSYHRSHSKEPVAQHRRNLSAAEHAWKQAAPEDVERGKDTLLRTCTFPASASAQGPRSPSGKSYGALAEAVDKDIAKASQRSSSGGNKRILSGEKKMYMHRHDRIWEDPQEQPEMNTDIDAQPEPVKAAIPPVQSSQYARKNPFARMRAQQPPKLEHSASAPVLPSTRYQPIEIQRNAPSQSRGAGYLTNENPLPTLPSATYQPPEPTSPTKNGIEIRSDDIRAATSKQRKDRSPNLPQPTLVSDKPGRPIVSFRQNAGPKEVVLQEVHSLIPDPVKGRELPMKSTPAAEKPRLGESTVSNMPPVPTLILPEEPDLPSIVLPEEPDFASTSVQSAPTTPAFNVGLPSIIIDVPTASASVSCRRPLPLPTRPGLPHHSATSPLPKSTPHYTPSVRQTGTLCAHCALPIAGRILSAAGERFHPSCFVCHQCHTNLECVAFYPEPDGKRSERVERIRAREAGINVAIPENDSLDDSLCQEAMDGDESLRFYCHLDFHELFSPRCKSCKTPIEGEVIVACGAEWHAGHFFCAQCGDPFDAHTPFVEKDGYAWCVGCHTNRYSSKCRKCRKPVTDLVVKALGADWHEGCFVCVECNGGFGDGRYFLRGDSQDPVCVRCEEMRLKA
ncbi:hypothetical protein BAUCODRAFT_118975 [Baudoinia panamericana UAMH 10762]|uniref:LIM zinc-binding domain-containing protein n=1 Tax=Baudoinia panamericana (strain UAMH 10762) TaxID=717646 RepID=M2MW98_BAUPA|nr:uncharacterized protein BAUCODRAFT_118975 [Baudoinia panamericana UAMH 10762]EMD01272.1 hypothetical protein BAUCODRAFT_118975 [Baudoinia panamericana UAMH 10762]